MSAPHRRQTSVERQIWSHDYLHIHSLQVVLREARGYVRGRVLDVGCGHQVYRDWFEAQPYIGVDVTREDSSPNVVALGGALPFADESFDAVLCTQVLEHVPNPFELMSEVARVLRRGGHLVLTAPQAWHLHEVPHDYFRYTRFGLAHLAQSHGLAVVRVQAQGKTFVHLGQTFLNLLPVYAYRVATPLTLLVNTICGALDALWWEEGDTLNNLLVARK